MGHMEGFGELAMHPASPGTARNQSRLKRNQVAVNQESGGQRTTGCCSEACGACRQLPAAPCDNGGEGAWRDLPRARLSEESPAFFANYQEVDKTAASSWRKQASSTQNLGLFSWFLPSLWFQRYPHCSTLPHPTPPSPSASHMLWVCVPQKVTLKTSVLLLARVTFAGNRLLQI